MAEHIKADLDRIWNTIRSVYGDEPFLFAQNIRFRPHAIDLSKIGHACVAIEGCTFDGYGILWPGYTMGVGDAAVNITDTNAVISPDTLAIRGCLFTGNHSWSIEGVTRPDGSAPDD